MKKPTLTVLISAVLATGAHGQGLIVIDNTVNSGNAAATTGGLIYTNSGASTVGAVLLSGAPANHINFNVYAGSSAGTLTLLGTFAYADNQTFLGGGGTFGDESGNSYAVPGVVGGALAFFDIQFWIGNATSWTAALGSGAPIADTGVFQNILGSVGGTPPVPPPDLTGMPSVIFAPVPEPATLAFLGLGAAGLLLFRRKK